MLKLLKDRLEGKSIRVQTLFRGSTGHLISVVSDSFGEVNGWLQSVLPPVVKKTKLTAASRNRLSIFDAQEVTNCVEVHAGAPAGEANSFKQF